MDASEFRRIWRALLGAYPEKDPPEETMELYIRCLADLPAQAVEAAVLAHVATSRWFPTVAELREKAAELLPGGRLPTATEAWAEVVKAFGAVGSYGVPAWSHPAIATTVEAMGWRQLCLSEEGMADRAHFLRLYETYAKRVREDQVQLPEVARLTRELAAAMAKPLSRGDSPIVPGLPAGSKN